MAAGPITRRSRRWFRSGAPSKKRAEQAHPPMTDAWSAARPACSDGFDNVDGGPECGVYIQIRGIEQVRIRRALQGGGRPLAVARVAAADVVQHVSLHDLMAGPLQLGGPAPGAHLGGGRDEDFHLGIREYDGSDVAAIEHRVPRRAPETSLGCEQRP